MMRITGFASGMDIDGIVKQMMMAERIPLDRLVQKKQTLEWQREAYRNFNTKLMDFRNLAFDMRLQSTYLHRTATVSDDKALTVSPGASATPGNYTIKVNQLATMAQLTSTEKIGVGDRHAKINSFLDPDSSEPFISEPTELMISGERGSATILIDPEDTLIQIEAKINALTRYTGVTANYDPTLDHFFFTSSTTGEQSKVQLSSENEHLLTEIFKLIKPEESDQIKGARIVGDATFDNVHQRINEDMSESQVLRIKYGDDHLDITINRNTTMDEIINRVNSSELGKAGLSAYLNADGQLTFFNPDENKTLSFENRTSLGEDEYGVPAGEVDVLDSLGVSSASTVDVNYYSASKKGQNAEIEYNGVIGVYDSNSFTINGKTFTLLQKTEEPIHIHISSNVDAALDKIKEFVEKYNELLDEMNKALTEKNYREYQPLTDWQKEEMSEKEIELWEERARSGLLRNDSILSRTVNSFRSAIIDSVQGLPIGALNHMFEIGITTGSYQERGKLYIDEDRLRAALAERPEEVIALFSTDDGDQVSSATDGIATRLYHIANTAMADIRDSAGYAGDVEANSRIGKELATLESRMRLFEERLSKKENQFYQQFTQMEKFIDQMNHQSMYLLQMFFSNNQ